MTVKATWCHAPSLRELMLDSDTLAGLAMLYQLIALATSLPVASIEMSYE